MRVGEASYILIIQWFWGDMRVHVLGDLRKGGGARSEFGMRREVEGLPWKTQTSYPRLSSAGGRPKASRG